METDVDKAFRQKIEEMEKLTEEQMEEQNLIRHQDVVKTIVKHAYCNECGEELISKTPPLFNPFTFQSICKHTCTKCGKVFNLEHAYPRVAYIDENNKEIMAYGL